MHKLRLNEFTLFAHIQPDGPILIKSGTESGADPTLPSMNFVRTRHPDFGERTIYLPGSSLKGTLRSHIERIIRTVYPEGDPTICCNPLSKQSCGHRIDRINSERKKRKQDPLTTAEEYRELCLACRIFGHTAHASHFTVSDAYPERPMDTLAVRQGVAINRFSGGAVGGALFEIEVATMGRFHLRLMVTNFELWQIGLLALALRDLGDGRLLIGFGKSRGLGKVNLSLTHLEIAYPGRFDSFDPHQKIYGAGALVKNDEMIKAYSLVGGDILNLPAGGRLDPEGTLWGRPAVSFGFDSPAEAKVGASQDAYERAHKNILAVLSAMVPAWSQYQKPGA